MPTPNNVADPKNFAEIQDEEIKHIHTLRQTHATTGSISTEKIPQEDANKTSKEDPDEISPADINKIKNSSVGLAFSGGGIRSASLGLGVLEALKEKGLLKKVDYLSTVSGGGYIGGWLSANCRRQGAAWLDDNAQWDKSIGHLRRFSNYLSPNISLFGADTWAMIAVWLRNTLLIQAVLVLAIAGVFLFPSLLFPVFEAIPTTAKWLGMFAFITVVCWICRNLQKFSVKEAKPCGIESGQSQAQIFVILSMFSSFCLAAFLWGQDTQPVLSFNLFFDDWPILLISWLTFSIFSIYSESDREKSQFPHSFMTFDFETKKIFTSALYISLPSVIVFDMLLVGIRSILSYWKQAGDSGIWQAFVWIPPMVLCAFSIALCFFIGMQGRKSNEYIREWWSRFGAWLAIYGFAWMAMVTIAVYGPLWGKMLYTNSSWQAFGIGGGWLGTTLAGLLAGKSASTDGSQSQSSVTFSKNIIAKIAPFVFIAGLLVVVSIGLHLLLANEAATFENLDTINRDRPINLIGFVAYWGIVILFARQIDINEFSLNAFYRNRLTRCYLGASRLDKTDGMVCRNPHQFTGFDQNDDLKLASLNDTINGPFHIVNCALNLGGSSDLSLHTRHSAIFTLTPLYCGSSYAHRNINGKLEKEIGYIATHQFGGERDSPTLGQAIAVSGAAASPNMGYHTSASVAFLLTLFNVRLGWWFPNPGKSACQYPSPTNSLSYLLKELFGLAGEKSDFLAISDGGHFENLSAYELIRRRCKVIIISDGECDPGLQYEGLANLIRLCKVDFDTTIDIDVSAINLNEKTGWSHNRCAIGRIFYPQDGTPPTEHGWLIYLKASMNGHEDTAVKQYKATHPEFPHETTADQFYSDNQFESYRSLGKDIAEKAFGKLDDSFFAGDMETIAEELYDIFSPSLNSTQDFTNHADKLMEIWDKLGGDPAFTAMDAVLFPPDADITGDARRIFYQCSEMIQLMENVYLDLNLENTWEHYDNQGWVKLFTKWANALQVQHAWDLTKSTYGVRFQSFWERKLDLRKSNGFS